MSVRAKISGRDKKPSRNKMHSFNKHKYAELDLIFSLAGNYAAAAA